MNNSQSACGPSPSGTGLYLCFDRPSDREGKERSEESKPEGKERKVMNCGRSSYTNDYS